MFRYNQNYRIMENSPNLSKIDWKRSIVLLAKNTHVWLDQLSSKYNTPINQLDQIPQEELTEIAARGFNALWLVGVWERSPASQEIKHLYGHKEAIASAYAIYEYKIAADLGGEQALQLLKESADNQGIQLACDMVPNHTGLDSPWVFKHPDWFISIRNNPVEDFRFDSQNLSPEPTADIFLEKGYYDQSGAAEVFKYHSKTDGEVLYIYHGNDGTSMPWNDTAQLDYLNPETRQAVMEEILSVAQKFKIIRLDAAMTLVREHFKRLWFPSKGGKKFIPTRGNNNMTNKEFDHLMPKEFWKEVIEKIKTDAPDTLFIAEAFWLMEKYFINEIGMHRVYNSAFMHQLLDEENSDFKEYLKDILQTDPRMLERFANFLTTPDERPTLDQFGKTEKYFGACQLLACMPGLPMFGHGQWEGLSERYGMDISHPMLEETPDTNLIEQHNEIITPLLRNRDLFASAEHFFLYDLVQDDGDLNNNVIAFSNLLDEERTLVIFNNKNTASQGTIRQSVKQIITPGSQEPLKIDIGKALGLPEKKNRIIILQDMISDESMEISIKTIFEDGIFFNLHPYECRVYKIHSGE